ncbi:hypothetical protein QYF61_024153 [Mycteria americana]|uniref:Uncharacterized protein n=1 Tax=Mycteria americana TaxID=33587 RepID=A0AAN7PLH1_MYCAM|nr:hypothetical protein QYF61_024153 [Mycteria americana]
MILKTSPSSSQTPCFAELISCSQQVWCLPLVNSPPVEVWRSVPTKGSVIAKAAGTMGKEKRKGYNFFQGYHFGKNFRYESDNENDFEINSKIELESMETEVFFPLKALWSMEKAMLEQAHLKATVAVDKSMPQQTTDCTAAEHIETDIKKRRLRLDNCNWKG